MPVIPCEGGILSISANGGFATGPGVSFADSNGVTFGVAGNTVTASVVGGAGGGIALGVPGSTITSGTAVLSNSNGVSFGINGSTITASVSPSIALAAGTQTATAGTVIFTNANGVSFGLDGSTVTASFNGAASISYWDNTIIPNDSVNIFFASRTLFQRVAFAHPIDATRMDLVLSWGSVTNNSSTNATIVIGVYTMTGSTANQASSFSASFATTAVSASSLRTFPVNFGFSQSEYWIGIGFTASGVPVLGGMPLNMWSAVPLIPSFGDALVTAGVSNPASIHVSQQTANPQGRAGIRFWGTF